MSCYADTSPFKERKKSKKNPAEYKFVSLPAWDGMVAANGRLYMTTLEGDVLNFSGNK
jgi:hypothetical protein